MIHRDWQAVTRQLSKAFHLTIFGTPGRKRITMPANFCYLVGGKSPLLREISHVEIIDIKDDDQLPDAAGEKFCTVSP